MFSGGSKENIEKKGVKANVWQGYEYDSGTVESSK